MATSITSSIYAQILGSANRYLAAAFTTTPSLGTLAVGTPITVDNLSYSGIPTPTVSYVLTVGGTSQSWPYTPVSADQNAAVSLTINLTSCGHTTSYGPLTGTIPTGGVVTATPLIGSNVSSSASYAPSPHFQNAIFDSRTPTLPNGSTLTSFDANGWPAVASQFVVSAIPGGAASGGQLSPGTYHCTVVSPTGAYCVPSLQTTTAGTFITNVVNQGDNATTKFDLITDAATNLALNLSTAVSFVDIPRDGSTSSAGKGWWYAPGVALHAKMQSLRFMDFLGTNSRTETNWAQRPQPPASSAAFVSASGPLISWELWIDYCNTAYAATGSKLKQVWLNLGPYIGTVLATAATDAATYGTNLATLLNTVPLNSNLKVKVEWGNEPWNPGFAQLNDYTKFAINELQVVTNYAGVSFGGGTPNTVTSVTSDGVNATVTASGSIPAYVSNGATCWATTSTNTFQGGTIASPATISNVTNLGGSYSFTYPCSSSGTMSGSFACIFNTTSNLITDGATNNNNLFNLGVKFMVRGAWRFQQAWVAVRPQDEFLLNIQAASFSSNGLAPMNFPPLHFNYANYLGGGSGAGADTSHAKNWLACTACAPYVSSSGVGTIASGSNQLTSFNLAASMRVGDTVIVQNAGSTTSLTSPVIAINGTNVSLRNNTVTAATGVTVTCSKGSGTGSMAANQNVITGLSIAGLAVGDIVTVPTANNPGLCAKVTDISAAGSGTLTLDTNAARTATAKGVFLTDCDPLSIIGAMNQNVGFVTDPTIRNHVYMNLKFGLKPIFYEGGPDTQTTPLKQVEVNTNAAIGTLITNLMDTVFKNGGSDFHYFYISPIYFVDRFGDFSGTGFTTSQDGWGACQTYFDDATAAPKQWALTGYTYPGTFANAYGNPGTLVVPTLAQGNGTLNSTTGLYYFSSNTILRNADWTATVNTTKTYNVTVWLADNAATTANVYIDGILAGTSTITAGAVNGSNNAAVATAGSSFSVALAAGPHVVSVQFPIGIGAVPGIQKVVFS